MKLWDQKMDIRMKNDENNEENNTQNYIPAVLKLYEHELQNENEQHNHHENQENEDNGNNNNLSDLKLCAQKDELQDDNQRLKSRT